LLFPDGLECLLEFALVADSCVPVEGHAQGGQCLCAVGRDPYCFTGLFHCLLCAAAESQQMGPPDIRHRIGWIELGGLAVLGDGVVQIALEVQFVSLSSDRRSVLYSSNQGDIDRQAIGGACATGTHGTGSRLQSLSAAVTGARIVLASGDIVECNAETESQLWQAARLNLGALGIVTQLELQLREAYRLQEQGWTIGFEELLPQLPELIPAPRHFEFFWYPQNDSAVVKTIEETSAEPVYPLGEEGGRTAWSYELLPNHRPHLHTEMEYSVPVERGADCLSEIRRLVQTQFPAVRWPVEYRTVAADDVWLSSAYQRDTVTISVHQDIREDESAYFRACEEIFLGFDGRPHWGKVNYLDGDALAAMHPRWLDWWAVRDQLDAEGVFLNAYLQHIRPD